MSHSIQIPIIPRWRSIAEQSVAAFFAAAFFVVLGAVVLLVTWHLTPHPASDAQQLDTESAQAP